MPAQIRLHITDRVPFADGTRFGAAGAYERLTGRVYFAIDPEDPAYRMVVDLAHAPRNARGLVEYATDVCLLKPVEMERGNRRLLYDVVNRGNKCVCNF